MKTCLDHDEAGNHRLTGRQVREIIDRATKGEKQADLARTYNISRYQVSRIVAGKAWKHLRGPVGGRTSCEALWRERDSIIDQLTREYMPLVTKEAHRMRRGLPRGIRLDNLIADGLRGLHEAIRIHDTQHHLLPFEQWAIHFVKGCMNAGLEAKYVLEPRPTRTSRATSTRTTSTASRNQSTHKCEKQGQDKQRA